MEVRKRRIKRLKYYLMLGIALFQFAILTYMCVMCIINRYLKIFIHATNWSFILSSIYLFSVCICDTSLYCFTSKKLEKFNHFMRNSFSIIAYPYCFMITIGFWLILVVGLIVKSDTFTKSGTKIIIQKILMTLYLHLGITILMVAELFLSDKEEVKINWCSGIANTAVFIIYGAVVFIAKFKYDLNAYIFMEELNLGGMILVAVTIFVILILSVVLHKVISNKINKHYILQLDNGEDENFLENDNTNGSIRIINEDEN